MPMVEMTEQMDFANDSDTGHSIDQKAFDDALEAAIAELSEDQREVVELRRQGVSFKEIAERQQTNLNTALCRMHYAISNLRNKLKDFMD